MKHSYVIYTSVQQVNNVLYMEQVNEAFLCRVGRDTLNHMNYLYYVNLKSELQKTAHLTRLLLIHPGTVFRHSVVLPTEEEAVQLLCALTCTKANSASESVGNTSAVSSKLVSSLLAPADPEWRALVSQRAAKSLRINMARTPALHCASHTLTSTALYSFTSCKN